MRQDGKYPGQWALLVGETPTLQCRCSGAPVNQITGLHYTNVPTQSDSLFGWYF